LWLLRKIDGTTVNQRGYAGSITTGRNITITSLIIPDPPVEAIPIIHYGNHKTIIATNSVYLGEGFEVEWGADFFANVVP
jgi:hypothetical protein